MKKEIGLLATLLVLCVFLLTFVSAEAIGIEKKVINDVIAIELNIPAEFNLTIENRNIFADQFKIFTLLDATLSPVGSFEIPEASKKSVVAKILPRERKEGRYKLTYYVRGQVTEAKEDYFAVSIKPLDEIITAEFPQAITMDDTFIPMKISNKEKINLGEAYLKLSSVFFEEEYNVSLKRNSTNELKIGLKNIRTTEAGNYPITFSYFLKDEEYTFETEKEIEFTPVTEIVTTETKKRSVLSYSFTVTKKNDGNTKKFVSIEIEKGSFEKLFTKTSAPATSIEKRDGAYVYTWQREIKPGEAFTVTATTSYVIPFIVLVVIIVIILIIHSIRKREVLLRKKVTRVIAKGAEFAFKITLRLKNLGAEVEDVTLVDRLPILAKIHERFGAVRPSKIEKNRLVWKMNRLLEGQETIFSYIIYSKVGIVGKLELPRAKVSYTNKEGKRKTVMSNKIDLLR